MDSPTFKNKITLSNDDLKTPSLSLLFRFIRKTVKIFYKNINITMAAYLVKLLRVCFMCSSLPLVRNWFLRSVLVDLDLDGGVVLLGRDHEDSVGGQVRVHILWLGARRQGVPEQKFSVRSLNSKFV
jgi:hypothetical protein